MSIKGLTDRNQAFPEIGSIRKGAKKGENRPGQDLTYFRVEFDEKEQARAAVFLKAYGGQPTEINILLPFNDIDRCWDAWMEAYTAGRMVARSDGERFIYLVDTATGNLLVQNGEPYTPYRKIVGTYKTQSGKTETIAMKPTGRLKVIIPELQSLAYLVVHTTSVHDIANLSAQLEALKAVNGGKIAGIPLVLRRRPKKVSMPKADGTRARVTKWMLSVEADPDWVKRMLCQLKTNALPGNGLALLPEGEKPFENGPEIEDDPGEDDDEGEPETGEDVQEGQFADAPTPPTPPEPPAQPAPKPAAPQPQPAPPPTEGVRSVAEIIAQFHKDLQTFAGRPISLGKAGLIVPTLEACFLDGDRAAKADRRHAVVKFLTGKEHMTALTDPEKIALYLWLKPWTNAEGKWVPGMNSAMEVNAVWREAMKANGAQPELFQDPEIEAQIPEEFRA